MNRRTVLFAAFAYALLGQSFAHGQRETERYIPIGQSPGASGKTTRIGTLEAADAGSNSFELATPEGRQKVSVPPGTPIWLDRSRQQRSAIGGGFADLQPGRRVEVGYADAGRAGRVLWIKVEAAE
ncbi:MAG: hypothetical protein WD775_00535 [Burkholderiales bacterium]